MNRYYEDLVFDSGAKINVSRQVNNAYFDTVHWHPYVELLVSRCDGNRATVIRRFFKTSAKNSKESDKI